MDRAHSIHPIPAIHRKDQPMKSRAAAACRGPTRTRQDRALLLLLLLLLRRRVVVVALVTTHSVPSHHGRGLVVRRGGLLLYLAVNFRDLHRAFVEADAQLPVVLS